MGSEFVSHLMTCEPGHAMACAHTDHIHYSIVFPQWLPYEEKLFYWRKYTLRHNQLQNALKIRASSWIIENKATGGRRVEGIGWEGVIYYRTGEEEKVEGWGGSHSGRRYWWKEWPLKEDEKKVEWTGEENWVIELGDRSEKGEKSNMEGDEGRGLGK